MTVASGSARSHSRVARAVSESGRVTRPASYDAATSCAISPAYSGIGSHSGTERGPDHGATSCA